MNKTLKLNSLNIPLTPEQQEILWKGMLALNRILMDELSDPEEIARWREGFPHPIDFLGQCIRHCREIDNDAAEAHSERFMMMEQNRSAY